MSGIFDQGGGTSFSFNNPGDVVQGVVQSVKVTQATKFDSVNWKPTNEPDVWPSGDPKMQVIVTLQTDLRTSEDDDGLRNVYATMTSAVGTLFRAIKDAIKAAGARDIEEGAWLQCWLAGFDPNSKNQRNPKKLYGANYQRPAPGAFGDQQAPQQQGLVGPGGGQVAQGGVQQSQLPIQQPQQGPPAQAAQPTVQQPPVQQGGQWTANTGTQPPQGFQPPVQGFQPPQFQQPPVQQQPPAAQPPQGPPPGQGIDFGQMMAQQAQQWEPPRPADMHQPPANPTPEQQQAMQAFYGNQQQAPAAQPPAQAAPAPQAAQPPAAASPAQQAPPPGATSQVDMGRVQALIAAQLDDEMIMQAIPGLDPATLQLMRNAG